MKKIAIVGVDGSGKTVLMTALGDKYENPDEFGLFLSPENSDAFGYVKLQMDRMRRGMWPGNTIAGKSRVLEWGLFRKVDGNNTRLCNLSFLDFSGEVYRMTFGSKNDHDAASYDDDEIASSINELRQHIKEADTLAVLINLKDIISGNLSNVRTREAMWLSKSILDYATRELHTPNIALVFTQMDAYRSTIAECGGVRGAYEKYLPHVANIYPDMKLLGVSAVNKTSPDDKGIPCPEVGFRSEGLDDMMEWIVSTVPGCETLISGIKNAPEKCREEAWDLRDEYIAVLSCEARLRQGVLDRLAKKLVELDSAMSIYPQALSTGALGLLQDEYQDMRSFEVGYEQLCGEIQSMDREQIHRSIEELCRGSSFADKFRLKVIDALFAVRERICAAVARKRRKMWWILVIYILVLGAIAVGAYFVHAKVERDRMVELERQEAERIAEQQRQEAERQRKERERIAELQRQKAERQREERALVAEEEASKSKIARGWSYEMRKGHKIAVWKPGAYHSQTTNLKADYEEDKWVSTKPGYVWTGETNTVWKVGVPYPGNPHCISSKNTNSWHAADGYKWAKPDETGNFDVVWNPSWMSTDRSKRATSYEGVFEEKISCSSCSGRGTVAAKRKCSNCNGTKRVSSFSTCSRCDGSGRTNESSTCSRCDGSGIYERSCPDCRPLNDRYGNYIAHGQVCDNCGGSGVVAATSTGLAGAFYQAAARLGQPQPMQICSKCNGYGAYQHSTCNRLGILRETCSRCDGNGKVGSSRRCGRCDGRGSISERVRCNDCDSNGQVVGSVNCSNCNGTGRVWRRM